MARADSTINVSIIGDAKRLIGAINDADKATGGILKSTLKVAVGAKVLETGVRKGFDILNSALDEADKRGDAITRLTLKLGDLAQPLIDTSDEFAKIGGSSTDIIDLEAHFADLAVSAGLSAPEIAKNAQAMAEAAQAASQIFNADPTEIIDAIGKATGGATRGLKPYGVDLTDAAVQQEAMRETGKDLPSQLTATELAAARAALIIQGFGGAVTEATTKTADLKQQQSELGARFETVMGKIGAGVEGPLADLLGFINDEIDAIPHAIQGWQNLGHAVESFGRTALGPLGNVRDALEGILSLLGQTGGIFSHGVDELSIIKAARNHDERNGPP